MNTQIQLQRMVRILEIARELTSTTSVDHVLHRILAAAVELTCSETAGILLEHGGVLHFVATHLHDQQLFDIPVPIEASIAGASFVSGKPVIVPDVQKDPRYYRQVEETIGYKGRSLLAVPLEYQEQRIGVLEVENKCEPRDCFTDEDIETLKALATQATVAIQNARLVEALQKARDEAREALAEQVRIQQELQRHRHHLEELVQQRTAKIACMVEESRMLNAELTEEIHEREQAETRLRAYSQQLEMRNEELDAFAHTVAHDLKNPLSLLLSCGELIAQDISESRYEDVQNSIRIINQTGRKMGTIIDELFLLASVHRQDEVPMEPLDMALIVGNAQARVDALIRKHQAKVLCPSRWPWAIGYGPWVEAVWSNYLSNAIRYGGSHDRGIVPEVILGADEEPLPKSGRAMIRFWAHDNGPGLSKEQQSQLFTEFTRLRPARLEGSGLGLSIVRRIIERLGGEVGVESTVGKGSRFYFTLRAANLLGE